jgi:hypothetical protein
VSALCIRAAGAASRLSATPQPARVQAILQQRRARRLLRRHLALALVKIKRPVQLILLCDQFLKPRLMLERLAELLLVIVLF